jgi:U3 small nucleolar RNA-associated protein 13
MVLTSSVLFLDCSKLIVTGSKDNSCRLWQWRDAESQYVCVGAAVGHTGAVGAVCVAQRPATYLSKQAFVISGSVDRTLKRWVLNMDSIGRSRGQGDSDGEDAPLDYLVCSHSTRAHEKDINSVASAPNDSVVASGSQDRSIKLWNPTDLTPIATLTGHKRGVWRVVFSPVDRCLLSASADRTLRLWSLQDHSCIRTFQGHTSSVLCAKFVNRGMQVLSGAADGVLKLWTIRSGECENSFDGEHTDRVWCIATPRQEPVSAEQRFCVTGSSDGSLRRWADTTAAEEEEQLRSEEEKYLVEQALNNDLRNKKYDKVSGTVRFACCVKCVLSCPSKKHIHLLPPGTVLWRRTNHGSAKLFTLCETDGSGGVAHGRLWRRARPAYRAA